MTRVNALIRPLTTVLFLLVVAVGMSCGGNDGPSETAGISSLGDLAGRKVGIASTTGMPALETRFVLLESYGLGTDGAADSVTLVETSADSLLDLLRDGEIAAAVAPPQSAFDLQQDERLAVVSNVTEEMRDITGTPVKASALVTYPEVLQSKPTPISDVNDLLEESVTYLDANRDAVVAALVEEEGLDDEFMSWLMERQHLALGDVSTDVQEQIVHTWEAARALGDIEEFPALEDVLAAFDEKENEEEGDAGRGGDRVTVSLAVRDTPLHRLGLYAVERGLVTSETIDLDVTFLSPTELTEAAAARQYDVIEVPPLAVPLGRERDLDFRIVSGGLQDLDSTLLFVLND